MQAYTTSPTVLYVAHCATPFIVCRVHDDASAQYWEPVVGPEQLVDGAHDLRSEVVTVGDASNVNVEYFQEYAGVQTPLTIIPPVVPAVHENAFSFVVTESGVPEQPICPEEYEVVVTEVPLMLYCVGIRKEEEGTAGECKHV